MKLLLTVMFFLLPGYVLADTVVCDNIYVDQVVVEADRDDNHPFANHLIVSFKDGSGAVYNCAAAQYTHLNLAHQAVNQLLSVALTAQASGRKVSVLVNTSNQINNSASAVLSNQLSAIAVQQQ